MTVLFATTESERWTWHTATRLRRTASPDPYSGEAALGPWSGAVEATLRRCVVAPSSTAEIEQSERQQVSARMSLYSKDLLDVKRTDRIRTEIGTFEVAGDLMVWRSPRTGRLFGVEVPLSRLDG